VFEPSVIVSIHEWENPRVAAEILELVVEVEVVVDLVWL
jgi:hypothetical protein